MNVVEFIANICIIPLFPMYGVEIINNIPSTKNEYCWKLVVWSIEHVWRISNVYFFPPLPFFCSLLLTYLIPESKGQNHILSQRIALTILKNRQHICICLPSVLKHLPTLIYVQVRSEKSFHVGKSLRHGCVQRAPCVDRTGWDQTMASPSLTTSCLLSSPSSSVSPWRAGLTCSTMYVLLHNVQNPFTHSVTLLSSSASPGKQSMYIKVKNAVKPE